MARVCPHCSRTNCADARFCYFDGASLLGSGALPESARKTFLAPFVFPSGEVCDNYDEFAGGCQRHWHVALDFLHKGFLENFFAGLGRLDLAHAAQEAAAFPDRDRGLDQFLGRLPTSSISLPKLEVQPKLINLGTLKVGVHSQFEISLENKGTRLIFGSVASTCDWFGPAETGEAKLFQFRDGASIAIQVKGQHLRGAAKPLEGTLLVESNAGTFTLKVIASVPIVPFAEGVLAGARTPREVAEKAKHAPRQAAPLFENGAVAKWYRSNGWTYPVQGPASNGVAAVQQFFEALGLSKPPKVFINSAHIQLKGKPGDRLQHAVQVRTEENRAVYAHAVSPANWLAVKPAQMHGNAVVLPLEISVPAEAGATVQAVLKVTANGQQRFDIPVEVAAERDHETARVAAALTVATPASIPVAKPAHNADFAFGPGNAANGASARFDPVKLLTHLAPLTLLFLVVFGIVTADVLSDKPRHVQVKEEAAEEQAAVGPNEPQFKVAIQDEPDDGPTVVPVARYKIEDEPEERLVKAAPVKVEIKDEPAEVGPKGGGKSAPIDPKLRVSYAYGSGRKWGLTDTATNKLLTFSPTGETNLTYVRVNGRILRFAGSDFRDWGDDAGRETRRGSSSTSHPVPGLKITQILEIVPSKQPVDVGGRQKRLMDTLLVRYIYENAGKQPINAGLRLEVDTLIGNNDGVPFTVPGKGLVNTSADFTRSALVPDFVQALETGNLRNPGTIVHISLKVGGGVEAPSRVVLCHWNTNGNLSNPFATNMGNDSCIIMVWPDQALPAGQKREMGYAYGLGSITVADPGGTLAVTLGGNFDIGQSFTITAYVNKPAPGQTLDLELPAGLERIKGDAKQSVPPATVGNTSIVSWEAKVLETGVFPVKVKSSTGVTQTKIVTIARSEAPAGGKLALDLRGSYEPGEMFTVFGKVTDPLLDQTLTLHLPESLQRTGGEATQRVPAPPAGLKESVLQWQVRVEKPGKYPVRVSSSTGVTQTKTITIVQPGRAEGAFQILLTGDFAPGKTFSVSTKVVNPAPDQKLSLVLPAGLELAGGEPTQTASANTPLAWQVKVREAGKFLVAVKSTTGVTQRKTVIIEPPSDQAGRFNFDITGDIRPGKEFTITAKVSDPLANQTLTLTLPKGLQLTCGEITQPVAPGKESAVIWRARCTEGRRLPVRIESSTGLARTKTITLTDNSTLFGR